MSDDMPSPMEAETEGRHAMTPRQQSMALIAEVASKYGVTAELICGRSLRQDGGLLRRARHEAVRRLHAERHLTSAAIGRLLNREASTVRLYMHPDVMEERIERVRNYRTLPKR